MTDALIEEPFLMTWNDWQARRSAEGGLPRGVRDSLVQQREVELYRAAMGRYRGVDYRDKLKRLREERQILRDRRKEVAVVAEGRGGVEKGD